MTYVLFILGFVFLIRGAEWLIDGASVLAKKFGISDLIIGLTVVAFGTSLPELIVNIFAGAESAGLAIGNVLGSNVANILLILGIAAIIHPLTVHRTVVNREVIFNIFAAGVLGVLVSERLLTSGGFDGLDRIDGVVLMSYFIIFLYFTFGRKTSAQVAEEGHMPDVPESINLANVMLKLILGILGLYFGGKWIVEGAISLASLAGVSDAFVGLTVVAIGTSLPELAATVISVKKGKVDIAVGNVLGSNLFNIFWVLGLSAFINPLPFDDTLLVDVVINFAVAVLLYAIMAVGKHKHQISKSEGWLFVSLYVTYIIFLVFRG